MKETDEVVLWGVKIGEPDWNEQIITNKAERIEDAKKWAKNNGFDRLRVDIIPLEMPDFSKIIKQAPTPNKAFIMAKAKAKLKLLALNF